MANCDDCEGALEEYNGATLSLMARGQRVPIVSSGPVIKKGGFAPPEYRVPMTYLTDMSHQCRGLAPAGEGMGGVIRASTGRIPWPEDEPRKLYN